MSTKDNGGPAFPAHHFDMVEGEHGLTMRDYFAAKALAGFLANSNQDYAPLTPDRPKMLAKNAYEMADAMLKAREE